MTIRRNPSEVRAHLATKLIDYDDLVEAVLRGYDSRGLGNDLHPSNYKGTLFHANTIEALRGLVLTKEGWHIDEPKNLAITFNSESDICIIVGTGNKYTGDEWRKPKTRSKKGAFFEAAVMQNAGEVPMRDLFESDEEYEARLLSLEAKQQALACENIYYLLIHDNDGEPVAELSKPTQLDDGWVSEWSERNILDLTIERGDDDEDGEEFDIPVSMK